MPLFSPAAPIDVLIADDDPLLRATMRAFLEQNGYTCAEAGDGREAVTVARDRHPQCVLLDLAMPELDGFAVASQLRADPHTRGMHIHCLTGRTDPDSRRRAAAVGCELFLPKPVEPAAVLQAVRGPVEPPSTGWITGLTSAEAEDLLDWLEANGYPPAELSFTDGVGFAVRCPHFSRQPPDLNRQGGQGQPVGAGQRPGAGQPLSAPLPASPSRERRQTEPEPMVRVYDFKSKGLIPIPASELAPGMVRATVGGIEGEFWIDPAQLASDIVLHPPLPPELRDHLVRLQAVFHAVFPRTLAAWEHGFRCDRDPEREIALWLRMAEAFEHFTASRELTSQEQQDLFAVIFTCVNNEASDIRFVLPTSGTLSAEQVHEIIRWLQDRRRRRRQ
jgi:CheY-like chemotaxis protein